MRKVRNLGQGLIVAGCLTQRYRKELPKLMPEVDVFMGIDQVEEVSQLVQVARKRRLQDLQKRNRPLRRLPSKRARIRPLRPP